MDYVKIQNGFTINYATKNILHEKQLAPIIWGSKLQKSFNAGEDNHRQSLVQAQSAEFLPMSEGRTMGKSTRFLKLEVCIEGPREFVQIRYEKLELS